MLRIAISGFGRIGRNFLRTILMDKEAQKYISVVAINIGPAKKEFVAHMFKYDTLMGTYSGNVYLKNDNLIINDHTISIMAQLYPKECNWSGLSVDWVVESSGKFTHKTDAIEHCHGGARYVLITAPAKEEDISIIPGVNEEAFDPKKQSIVSLGSCTTNAFIPLVKVLHDEFGIRRGFMTTTHAYTNTQVLLDVEDKDLRRSRAAALNIIPTTTGAAKMLEKIMPEMAGLIEARALRIPVPKVSLIDFVCDTNKELNVDIIHQAFKKAMENRMKGIIDITMEPLVSSDFNNSHYSVVIDGLLTSAKGTMAEVFGWYDNEWGYCERLKDFLVYVGKKFS